MYNLETLPDHLIFNILKYFQTHRYQNTFKNKYEIRIKNKIKTDVKSIMSLSQTNRYFNDLIFNKNKIFWIVYYSSLLDISKENVHSRYCTNKCCKNVSHIINRSRDKKYTNVLQRIKKIRVN